MTPLAAALPVEISSHDDRIEEPEGVTPIVAHDYPVLKGVPRAWPYFLGYNRFKPKAGSQVILSIGEDPFLVVGQHGVGRVGFRFGLLATLGKPGILGLASLFCVLVAVDDMASRLVTHRASRPPGFRWRSPSGAPPLRGD